MASVRKITYTKPVPKTAEIIEKQGQRFARWRSGGKTITAPLSEDGRRVSIESAKWYAVYMVGGQERREPGYPDKQATQALAVRLEREHARRAEGLIDPHADERQRPLAQHITEYADHLRAERRTEEHVGHVLGRLQAVAEGCGWATLDHLDAGEAVLWLGQQQGDTSPVPLPAGKTTFTQAELADLLDWPVIRVRNTIYHLRLQGTGNGRARRYGRDVAEALAQHGTKGISPQTVNHYKVTLKAFGGWLVESKRLAVNPFAGLVRGKVDADRRHDRRELTPEGGRPV